MTISKPVRRLALVAALSVAGCSNPLGEPAPPNIVLLVGDDQGWSDFGFTGSPWVRTPNLDRLAAAGVVFELGHSTASHCRPSLNSLLTGLFPFQWRLRVGRPPDTAEGPAPEAAGDGFAIARFETLPGLLAERGYATFQAGKLWDTDFRAAGFADGMADRFDPAIPYSAAGAKLGRETLEPVWRFLDRQQAGGEGPFFLWFAPMLPHLPHDAPPRHREAYEGRGLSKSARAYFASCTWLDAVVGELLDSLEARGLAENTLVVFVSDNGWEQGPHDERVGHVEALMGGARGKLSLHDFGFRTPVVFRLPGEIAPRRIADTLVSTTDVVPTLLDYAGARVPPELPGTSLRPVLEGRGELEREFVIGSAERVRRDHSLPLLSFQELKDRQDEIYPLVRAFYLRSLDWHYVWYEGQNRQELYHLARDPLEEHDVAADHPTLTARFRAEIERWQQEVARPFAADAR